MLEVRINSIRIHLEAIDAIRINWLAAKIKSKS
jgi:hypothetical protein